MSVHKIPSNYSRVAYVSWRYQAITPCTRRIQMFRKISFAAIAALALTAAVVAPASAGGHGGGHGMHGGGHGFGGHWGGGHRHGRYFGSAFYVGGSCYKTVFTEFGPRRVNV